MDLVAIAARLLNDALNFSEPEKAYDEIKAMAAMCDTKSRLRMLSLIHGGGLIYRVAHSIPDDVYVGLAQQKLDSVFTAASILLDRAESLSRTA